MAGVSGDTSQFGTETQTDPLDDKADDQVGGRHRERH
jgi:hypothetical protein